jgi:hypothetical protein
MRSVSDEEVAVLTCCIRYRVDPRPCLGVVYLAAERQTERHRAAPQSSVTSASAPFPDCQATKASSRQPQVMAQARQTGGSVPVRARCPPSGRFTSVRSRQGRDPRGRGLLNAVSGVVRRAEDGTGGQTWRGSRRVKGLACQQEAAALWISATGAQLAATRAATSAIDSEATNKWFSVGG